MAGGVGVVSRARDSLSLRRGTMVGEGAGRGLGKGGILDGMRPQVRGRPRVGFLVCPGDTRPLLVGGSQEDGRRAGTENVPGVLACVAALEARERVLRERLPKERGSGRDRFEARLLQGVAGVRILGSGARRLWNTSAFVMPEVDCRRRWVVRLDKLGFAVSTGSACSSGQEKPSHVLAAMGIDGVGERVLRVSGGWETPEEDWDALAEALEGVAREWGLRSPG